VAIPRKAKDFQIDTVLRYTTKDGYTGSIVKVRTVERADPEEPEITPAARPKDRTRRRIR